MVKIAAMKLLTLCILFLVSVIPASARIYYVSPTGSDANVGYDINAPFKTMKKALGKSDLTEIIVRGGTHYITGDSTVSINKIGAGPGAYIIRNYPGERPLFDCSGLNATKKGFSVTGSYWHIIGIDIMKARDNGMYITGANNIIEFCSFFENEDSGLQLSAGATSNQIINCDSYYNKDATSENADGFACKLDVGPNNSFKGCRSWQNSDDGWDGYIRPSATYNSDNISTTLDSCWSFRNGYLKTGALSGVNGDGNGFKMGGSDSTNKRHNQTLTHCVSFYNRKRGFDQNNNKGSMTLYNNTAFANGGGNYVMNSISLAAGSAMTVKNCIAFTASNNAGSNAFVSGAVLQNNSWQSPFTTTNTDFISIDTVGARGPRKPDGSLPDVDFMHLAEGSDLVDGGQDVGLVFSGTAPDLGAFETAPAASVVYIFNGNGNWDDAANWLNNAIPPATLNPGNQIIIDPIASGECILNITYTVSPGASFVVMAGKQFSIPLNLTITY
jgi:hypothetical protein